MRPMTNREEILYPMQGADGNTIVLKPWIPNAIAYGSFQGYTLLRSAPEKSTDDTIQFRVRKNTKKDLMRVDNYKEGYFAAVWQSTITLEEFLESAEAYFRNLDHLFAGKTLCNFRIFTSFRDSEAYEFGRPLTLNELQTNGVFLGNEEHSLGLFRINTPAGDLILEPEDRQVSLIKYLEPAAHDQVIQAAGKFVSQTQELLTPDVVAKVLNDLPYRKTA